MVRIFAPVRTYNGIAANVRFTDGQADTDNAAAIAYFTRAGYGIGRPAGAPAPEPRFEPQPATVQLGTPLRDAAVDPMPQDFLPPTNAGEADPHGPLVVSPQLHGSETGPIRPGEVFVDDLPRQQAAETALAQAVFVEHQDVGEATAAAQADGSARNDPLPAADAVVAQAPDPEVPGSSAKKADWVAYAEARGIPRDEAEDLTIAQLRERTGASTP